jgi:hypothetical protein
MRNLLLGPMGQKADTSHSHDLRPSCDVVFWSCPLVLSVSCQIWRAPLHQTPAYHCVSTIAERDTRMLAFHVSIRLPVSMLPLVVALASRSP